MSSSQQSVLSGVEVHWWYTHECKVDLLRSWAQILSLPGS